LVLPNGSARVHPSLQAQQHSEHPFEFAVEMDLIVAEPLQLVGIERLTERLLTDQRPVRQFLPARLDFERTIPSIT
jgi:hypothetical protein